MVPPPRDGRCQGAGSGASACAGPRPPTSSADQRGQHRPRPPVPSTTAATWGMWGREQDRPRTRGSRCCRPGGVSRPATTTPSRASSSWQVQQCAGTLAGRRGCLPGCHHPSKPQPCCHTPHHRWAENRTAGRRALAEGGTQSAASGGRPVGGKFTPNHQPHNTKGPGTAARARATTIARCAAGAAGGCSPSKHCLHASCASCPGVAVLPRARPGRPRPLAPAYLHACLPAACLLVCLPAACLPAQCCCRRRRVRAGSGRPPDIDSAARVCCPPSGGARAAASCCPIQQRAAL
jgi:hypothetical protein